MSGINKLNSVRVSIYDKEYDIVGEASREEILRYAQYVDEKIRELLNGVKHPFSVELMLLAALNITEDLFKLREEKGEVPNISREKNPQTEYTDTPLWKDDDYFIQREQVYEEAKEEILNIERECEIARAEAEKLKLTNKDLQSRMELLKSEIDDLKSKNIQMQMYFPDDAASKDAAADNSGMTLENKAENINLVTETEIAEKTEGLSLNEPPNSLSEDAEGNLEHVNKTNNNRTGYNRAKKKRRRNKRR